MKFVENFLKAFDPYSTQEVIKNSYECPLIISKNGEGVGVEREWAAVKD